MPDTVARIAENLAGIRSRMAAAAARAGRAPGDVKLLVITKYVGPEVVRALVEAGCTELGESRPQQLWDKAEALHDLPICWHLVGHLQRNKVRRTLPLVSMIHSVDSLRLAAALEDACGAGVPPAHCRAGVPPAQNADRRDAYPAKLPILLEVNVSGEAAKHGLAPAEVGPLLTQLAGYGNLEVRGLMCMAALEGGPDTARRDFAALRSLRDRVRSNCLANIRLDELSMGMSGDYEAAVEEGATIVRIGSAVFEGIFS